MSFDSWAALYASDLQSVYAPWIVPLAFLAWAASRRPDPASTIEPARARFVRLWAIVFAVETIVDPFATGPLARSLGIAGSSAGTALMVAFVLLGDFRVFLLVLGVSSGARSSPSVALESAAWTLVVPVAAAVTVAILDQVVPGLPGQTVWLVYECYFAALAVYVATRILPARTSGPVLAYSSAILAYVTVYYALWATADVLILIGGLDAGWALRILPNQLYYSFFVPFAYFLFFSFRGRC